MYLDKNTDCTSSVPKKTVLFTPRFRSYEVLQRHTHTHTHTDRQDSHSKANWLTQNLPNGQNPTESIYHSLIYVFNELIRLR